MKSDLIAKLTRNRDELLNVLASLSEKQITAITIVEDWTIKDLVGHISYWEQIILDHIRESLTEGKPQPLRADESEDAINARESKKRKGWKWSRVRAEFEYTRRALIERVEKLNEMELSFIVPNPWWWRDSAEGIETRNKGNYAPRWHDREHQNEFYSIAQMIQEDALEHSAEHIEQIKLRIVAASH